MPLMSSLSKPSVAPPLTVLSILALSACGGSSSSPTVATSVAATATTTVWTAPAQVGVAYAGVAQGASLPSGATAATVDNNGTAGSVTLTATSGGATLNAANVGGPINLTQQSTTPSVAGLAAVAYTGTAVGGGAVTLNSLGVGTSGYSTGLSYSDFGIWTVSTSSVATNIGAYALGSVTPVSSVPTSGTAVYSGSMAGEVWIGTTLYTVSGPLSLNANFASNTISGGTTTTSVYSTGTTPTLSGTMNNLNFTGGTISGNSFSGIAQAAAPVGTIANISGATGAFSGKFFGPAAQEATGTFQLSGGSNLVVGSFGTRK